MATASRLATTSSSDDVVRANIAAVGRPGFAVFNVGTGVETDVNALFESIAEAADYDAAPGHGPGMPGEQRRSCITSERLLEELSVAVDTPLADRNSGNCRLVSQAVKRPCSA